MPATRTFGASTGFNAGSTFKLFTLLDWLEKGHSVNETLNGTLRIFKKMTDLRRDLDEHAPPSRPATSATDPGRIGTPMQFTASSLNTGYFAMAEKLDLCDIGNVATKLGVMDTYNNAPVKMDGLNTVIGTANVSPLAIAEAYATVANNGTYCQPQVIDRVTDSDGNELPKPERTCSPVLDPKVAATAAYALQGVMNGGTGAQGKPRDGVAAHRQDRYPRRAPVVARRVQHQGRDRDVGGQRPGRWGHLQDLPQRASAVRHPLPRHAGRSERGQRRVRGRPIPGARL